MMQSPFNKIAATYDESFTNTKIGRLQRNIVHSYLDKALFNNRQLNILELNCGTGEDAVWFAERGHTVLATDTSEEMLRVTEKKVSQYNFNDKIKTKKVDLTSFETSNLNEKFDLIFSNFGGINCIDQTSITHLGNVLPLLLNTKGRLIFVIMSKFCFWESFYYLMKLQFKEVFRRSKNDFTKVDIGGSIVHTYYYSSQSIFNFFIDNFKLVATVPIGFLIPPSYLNQFFERNDNLLNYLNKFERLSSKFRFLSNVSDHFLMDMELKS